MLRVCLGLLLIATLAAAGVAAMFHDAGPPEQTDDSDHAVRRACDDLGADLDREIACLRDALQNKEARIGALEAQRDEADRLRAELGTSLARIQDLEAQLQEDVRRQAHEQPTAPAADEAPGATLDERPVERSTDGPADMATLPDDAPADLRQVAALARDGNANAQHDLATAYAVGTTIPQDFDRAAYWYRQSADAGVVNAHYNLGVLTERGLGVEQDSEAAFAMFLEAANADHADAQNAAGLGYMHGHGTRRDLLEAAELFEAAYCNGNPRSAYHLGRLLEQGLNGPPEPTVAARWYRAAVEAGDPQAVQALEWLGQPPEGPVAGCI